MKTIHYFAGGEAQEGCDIRDYAYHLFLQGGIDALEFDVKSGEKIIVNEVEWDACRDYRDDEGEDWVYDSSEECWYSDKLRRVVPDKDVPSCLLNRLAEEDDYNWRQYRKKDSEQDCHKAKEQDWSTIDYPDLEGYEVWEKYYS